jgi:tetratricopeptide (TPR) repeat protein
MLLSGLVLRPNWHENSALGCFATEEGGNTCVGLTLVRSSINAGGTFASTAGSNGMLLSFVWTEHAVPSIQMHGDVPCPLCRAIQRPSDTCETSAARCPVCLEDTACNKLACGHDMCAVCWARWTSASDGSQFIEEFLDMEEKAKFEYFNASFGELLEVDKFNDEERRLYAISFRDFICSQCGVAAEASGHYRLAAQFYAKCCDLLREETCSPFYISGRLYFHFAHGTRWNALGLALMRGASNADDLNRSLDVFDEAMGFLQDSGDTKTADALKTTCRNRAAVLREMNFWTGSALEHRYSYLKEEIEYCKLSGCDSAQLQAKAYSEHHLKVGDHPYYDIHQRAALMRGQKELTRLSNLYTSINPEGIPAAVKTDNAPEDTLICSDGDTGGGDATEDSARLMMTDEDGIEWIVSLDTTGDQGLTVTVEQNSGAPAKPEAAQRIMAKVQASMDGITEGNVMLGCIDEGLESDDQLCADDASGFTALKRQGDEAFRASKYEEAVEHYTEALALNEDHLVFCNRASAYINAKNFDAALSDAYRCTSLCPSFAKGWIRGAQAAGSCGKQGQAWSFARAGARLHPDNKELRDYHKIATKCCLVDPDNPRYMSDVNGHNWFTRNELQPFGDSLGSLVGGTEALIGELTDWMHEVDGISCAVDNTESLKQLELQFCEILFDAGRSKASLFDALRELGGEHTELVTNLSAAGKRLSDALQSFREESSSSDAADFLLSFGKGCEFFVGDLVLLSAVEGQTGVGEDQTADFTLMDQKTALIVGDKVQGMWPVQLQYAKPFVGNKWIVHVPEAAMSLLYSTVRSNLKRGLAHGVFQFERHVSGSVSLQMLPKDRTVANSVLAAAVNANQLKGVREALKRGASPDTLVGKPAVCALFVACQNGNGPIVKELIAHGANLEFEIMATEGQGVDTHVGRSNAHLSLEALLSCPQGATSLLIAAENALPLIVQILLTHGANPNAVGDDGCSPLFAAARAGNLRCVELLCEAVRKTPCFAPFCTKNDHSTKTGSGQLRETGVFRRVLTSKVRRSFLPRGLVRVLSASQLLSVMLASSRIWPSVGQTSSTVRRCR